MGRPSSYTKEIGDKICELIATSSKGLNRICSEHGDLPSATSVYRWLDKEEFIEFREQYARAKEHQADFIADEIIEIADNECRTTTIYTSAVTTDEEGNEKPSQTMTETDNTQRSRLQVDARKWRAAKLAPKKYGDKIDVTSGGDKIANSPDLSHLSYEQLKEIAGDDTDSSETGAGEA